MPDPFVLAGKAEEEQEGGVRYDSKNRYLIPDPETGRDVSWTRTTNFAKTLAETAALQRWGERMAVKGVADRQDLVSLAAATPLDDRRTLDRIAQEAKTSAGAWSRAKQGTALHTLTERVDKGEIQAGDIGAPWGPLVRAYVEALDQHKVQVIPDMIERTVVVKRFKVAGTFDRIVRMPNDELWIMDLKTGRDLSYAWAEIAVQLAVYAHADAIYDFEKRAFEPMPKVNQEQALVVHLPTEGTGCTLWRVNITHGWAAAELSERVANWRKFKGLAEQVAQVQAEQPDLSRWVTEIQAATSVEDLSAIWKAASTVGEWSDELTELGLAKKQELVQH